LSASESISKNTIAETGLINRFWPWQPEAQSRFLWSGKHQEIAAMGPKIRGHMLEFSSQNIQRVCQCSKPQNHH
jgi:hypothetical protein